MAYLFDDGGDRVALADNAILTLPDADWAIAGWVKLTTTSISAEAGVFVWTDGGNNICYMVLPNAGGSTDEIRFRVRDGDSDSTGDIDSTTSPFAGNTNWTHIILERSGGASGVFTCYINAIQVSTTTNGNIDSVNVNSPIYFGNRFDFATPFPGAMAEWARWDRALDASERAALVAGFAPSFFQNSLVWYVPMIREYVELKSGLVVTNANTTATPHPPIIYPSGPYIIQAPVSAGETFEFAGSETVSFDGSVSMVQTATFADSQTVSFDGTAAMIQTATMTGAEEVSFDGTADTIRNQWAFDGSEDVLFDGTAGLQQDAAFTGAESVSFDGSVALKQSAALTGSETVSFDGEAALDVAAIAFAGQGVLSFDGSIATLNLILEMEAAAAISFDGEAAIGQQALFEGGATLSFDGVAALTGFSWDPVETPASVTWSDVD